jgi:hypothetical protein
MEFTNDHHHAFTLAGAVALPSPYPATAQAFFALTDWDSEQVIYVKLVQVVGSKQIISRFIRPEDIRAIRPKPTAPGTSDDPNDWPVLSPAKTQKEIHAGEAAILAHAKAAKLKYLEELWHPEVIFYVPETAAVLHRHESGVTAAVSAEGFLRPLGVCCNN